MVLSHKKKKEKNINKKKDIILEDDAKNKNSIKKISRNYFEYRIENFSDFINETNEQYSRIFEVGNYKW